MHFTFNNETHQQCDGVAMGSPLGPVIPEIFKVELEKPLIPTLMEDMCPWERYMGDTIADIKLISLEHIYVLSILNSFHQNTKFTYEFEQNGKINFLDVLLIRMNDTLQTTIHKKSTHNHVYLHWNSFTPRTWKRGTLQTILIRAYKISSTK